MRWLALCVMLMVGCHGRRFRPFEHAHVHQHALAIGEKALDATR